MSLARMQRLLRDDPYTFGVLGGAILWSEMMLPQQHNVKRVLNEDETPVQNFASICEK
jgi:hypothetical protein